MHHLGDWSGPIKLLKSNAAVGMLPRGSSAHQLCLGLWPSYLRPPNPRVQRTRVARCARPGSPLTRHPFGDEFGNDAEFCFQRVTPALGGEAGGLPTVRFTASRR
jgi:hypothetical protein